MQKKPESSEPKVSFLARLRRKVSLPNKGPDAREKSAKVTSSPEALLGKSLKKIGFKHNDRRMKEAGQKLLREARS